MASAAPMIAPGEGGRGLPEYEITPANPQQDVKLAFDVPHRNAFLQIIDS
jgi:hypothetical protein